MAFMFSNPTPDPQNDPAKLQSQFQVRAPEIGSLVAAILAGRYRNAELQRQQMQDLSSGISSAAKGIGQYQQAGNANDASNAAMYFQNNPGTYNQYLQSGQSLGDFANQNVPDYGGTDATNNVNLQQGMIAQQLQNQQSIAKTNAMQALADQRNDPGDPTDTSAADIRKQQIIDTARASAARQNLRDTLGIPQGGQNDQLPAAINTLNQYQPGVPGVAGTSANIFPPTAGGVSTGVTSGGSPDQGARKDQILNALRMYQAAAAARGGYATQAPAAQVPPITPQGVSPATSVPTPAPQGGGAPAAGTVRVVSPQGQAGTIPAERLQDYINAGYHQI